MSNEFRGRGLRATALAAVLVTLVLAGGWYVWELRGIAAHRADGNPAEGSYQQDPERADRTAFAVLESVTQGSPEPGRTPRPPPAPHRSGGGPAAGSPPPPWKPGPYPPRPRSGHCSPPATTPTPTTTARRSWSTPPAAT
ncbi:hypothetical protein [Streptomyces antarcticus]|uniref:hypothetical protein n=1 Tax=Streptomyces antarcticus TaxID=2996458 RepID=UPI0022AEBBB3|nr:hypothetical protein [Streptomyces sp. H34-S5]MCZ4087925.1 hypothetical protein [Streptomyces sp. H34-S5]